MGRLNAPANQSNPNSRLGLLQTSGGLKPYEAYNQQVLANQVQSIVDNKSNLNTQQQYNLLKQARDAGVINKDQHMQLIDTVGNKAISNVYKQNQPPVWQQALYNAVNFVNEAAVKPTAQAINILGQAPASVIYDIGATLSGQKARLQKQIAENDTAFMKAINAAKQPGISAQDKQKYLRQAGMYSNLSNTLRQQQVAQQQDVVSSTNPEKLAGAALTLGSLFIPGGKVATGIKALATGQRAAKVATVAGRAAEGGLVGGAFGTGIAMQEGKPLPEIARSALETALLGAGIGVIAPPLLSFANKGLKKANTSVGEIVGRIRGRPIEPVVPPAGTQRIPVRQVETGQVSMQRMNDAEFASSLSRMSANYDKEIAKVAKIKGTIARENAATKLEARYEKQVNKLVDDYNSGRLIPKAATQVEAPRVAAPEPVPVTPAAAAVPEVPVAPTAPPAAPVSTAAGLGEQKIAGGALKAEARAVENKLVDEFQDLPTYATVSFKDEAALATNLVRQDRQAAIDIAIGKASARNDVQRAAVASALEREAMKANDVELLQKLASSPRYTRTSEAAQTLGAEGFFFDPTSPSILINQLKEVRKKAFEFRKRTSTDKLVAVEASKINKSIKAPTKDDWNSFIESLRC